MADLDYTFAQGFGNGTTGPEVVGVSIPLAAEAPYIIIGSAVIDCITSSPAAYAKPYLNVLDDFYPPFPWPSTASTLAPHRPSGGAPVPGANRLVHSFIDLFSSPTGAIAQYSLSASGTIDTAANIRNPCLLGINVGTLNGNIDYFWTTSNSTFALSGGWTTIGSFPIVLPGDGSSYIIFAYCRVFNPTTAGGAAAQIRLTRDGVPLQTRYTRTPQSTGSYYVEGIIHILENETSPVTLALQASSGGNWASANYLRFFVLNLDRFSNISYQQMSALGLMPDPYTQQASAAITPAMVSPEVIVIGSLVTGYTTAQDVSGHSVSANASPIYQAGAYTGDGLINDGGTQPEGMQTAFIQRQTPTSGVPVTYSSDTDRYYGTPTVDQAVIVAFEPTLNPAVIPANMTGSLNMGAGYEYWSLTKAVDMAGSINLGGTFYTILGKRFAEMRISIVGQVLRTIGMNMYILGGKKLALNVSIQGGVQKTASMDVQISGVPLVRTGLDMVILNETPYRFMRMRGSFLTRYFGGEASDPNFPALFNPPSLSGVEKEDIGVFNAAYRSLVFTTTNQIPTPSVYDRYSLLLDSDATLDTIGLRVLAAFRIESFGPNSDLTLGLVGSNLSPQELPATGNVALLRFEAEKGHVELRAYLGTSSSTRTATGLPIDFFIGKDLILEIEQVDQGVINTVEFRLYDRDQSLAVPLFTIVGRTSSTPIVDRFSISSYGRATPELPTAQPDMMVAFEYVDVELATGAIYNPPGTGVPLIEAKWRPLQDRPPIELAAEGVNTVYVALSADGSTSNIETSDSVEVDSSDPQITVVEFTPDSPIIVPGSTNPPIVKGSLNTGFAGVTMKWKCTHAGVYTVRVNSTSRIDGLEIGSGNYPVADAEVYTTWNFSSLPAVDGVYDVTLYVLADTGKATAKKLGIYIL